MCDHKGERWVYYVLAVAAILAFIAYFWVRHSRFGY
jgi:ABC-type branched-subunit amino acid transport system permease subunit